MKLSELRVQHIYLQHVRIQAAVIGHISHPLLCNINAAAQKEASFALITAFSKACRLCLLTMLMATGPESGLLTYR